MSKAGRKQEDLAPRWMDKTFFEKALQSSDGDPDLTVTSTQVERATALGDNFLSVMYRVTVQVKRGDKTEERSLIVKTEPTMEAMVQVAAKGVVFEREVKMLRDIIPEMNRLLEEIMPGKCQPFGAKFIYSHKGTENNVIVLEDLKKTGFKMADKSKGLDLNHCLLVMRALARFHAASVALKKRNPKLLEPFMKNEMIEVFGSEFKDMFSFLFANVAKEIEKWPKCGERYSKKILNIAPNAADMHVKGRTRDDEEFNVLSHGDLWANNIMFSYSDSGYPLDLRFVDFQISYWVSPALDLQNFIVSSTSCGLLDSPNILLQEYYSTLEETLTLFGYKNLLPSWEKFNNLLAKRGHYATACLLSVRCSVVSQPNTFPDKDGSFHYSEAYMKSLKRILPVFEEKEWF
ncbi:uncharacterized protein [Periplaneta americana]|uniref:uncharacterized protein isoform X1 n=1 Tax=Periplaneta americana TaxID=6978 RepID=UPI0037E97E1B